MDNVINNFYLNGGPLRGMLERKLQEIENKVLRNYINDYTIDSCYTFDEGYETAIWKKGGHIIIVERYETREQMEARHKKWCEFCKSNPQKAYSVSTEEIEYFEEE